MYKSNRQVLIQAHSLCNSRLWLVYICEIWIDAVRLASNNELFVVIVIFFLFSSYFIHKLTVHFFTH